MRFEGGLRRTQSAAGILGRKSNRNFPLKHTEKSKEVLWKNQRETFKNFDHFERSSRFFLEDLKNLETKLEICWGYSFNLNFLSIKSLKRGGWKRTSNGWKSYFHPSSQRHLLPRSDCLVGARKIKWMMSIDDKRCLKRRPSPSRPNRATAY